MLIIPKVKVNLESYPKVSCIILTKNNADKLIKCIDSILNENYPNLQIIIGDTGSNFDSKQLMKKYFADKPEIILEYGLEYHFSKNSNYLVKKYASDTDLLLFSNNDIEIMNNAIHQMVFAFSVPNNNIGCVGIQLLFPNSTIQHAGVKLFELHDGSKLTPRFTVGHININSINYNYNPEFVFAVTAAFMMTSKQNWDKIGGFREDCISIFQDVIFNAECIRFGLKNVCINCVIAFHDESSTRRKDNQDNIKFQKDLKERLNPYIKENYGILKQYIVKNYIDINA